MLITKKGTNESTIQVEEEFRAPKDKVFKAWTNPESLKKWFMADDNVKVLDAAVALQVGGAYFIEVLFPGYDPSKIEGVFSKVDQPNQLGYSWLTPVLNGRKTNVEVRFEDHGIGSKIYLSHGEFLNENELQLHLEGWKGCIGKLHEHLEELQRGL